VNIFRGEAKGGRQGWKEKEREEGEGGREGGYLKISIYYKKGCRRVNMVKILSTHV
jgi:hypothetical protein